MTGYFSFFPSFKYSDPLNGPSATNIIAKIQFDAAILKRSVNFYPYTVTNDERADHIAENYYGDSSYDWLVYLSNNIIDPQNEWPKSENVMNDFLIAKYGSIANTQQQIAYYQVNYAYDERVIGTNVYQALAGNQKKYWAPIVNTRDKVISYQRKVLDTVADTNQVVMLTGQFDGLSSTDVIHQSNNVVGTVSFANSSTVVMKNISGTWASNTSTYYSSTGNLANASITSTSIVNQPIPSDEIDYWAPVTIYQSETTINENRKHIRLMNSAFVDAVERDMKDLL